MLIACGPALPIAAQDDVALWADPPAAPVKLNLDYTVPEACVIVAARPSQLFRAPALEMLPFEVFQAASKKELGVDVLKLDQLIISASPPIQGPPAFAIYGEFSEPSSLQSGDIERSTVEAQIGGRTYRRARNGPMEPSIYQPTDNAILLAPDPTVRAFVEEQGRKSDLAYEVSAAAKTDDLFALVNVEALRPLIGMGLSQAPIPPELQSLTRLPDLIKTIELRLNLSGAGVSELVATANSAADAQAVVDILDGLKQQARDAANAQIARMAASDDPLERAMARYQRRLLKRMDETVQLQVDGDRLTVFHVDPDDPAGAAALTQTAVIGVLVALLLPAVQASREAARRMSSVNNLRQIMIALLTRESAMGVFPAQANYDAEGKPLLSWRVHILPFVEQQALYEQFHFDEPWDSEHNRQLIPMMPEIYLDPSSTLSPTDGLTSYLGVAGKGHAFAVSGKGNPLRRFSDGTSNSIAVVQVNDDMAVEWTKPADFTPPEGDPLVRLRGGLHPGIFNAAFADASVQAISDDVDPTMFRAMLTIDGGEIVNNW